MLFLGTCEDKTVFEKRLSNIRFVLKQYTPNITIMNLTVVNVISYSYQNNKFLSWYSLGAKHA
jgi:hypothetical protein